jgi:hypothetical protein
MTIKQYAIVGLPSSTFPVVLAYGFHCTEPEGDTVTVTDNDMIGPILEEVVRITTPCLPACLPACLPVSDSINRWGVIYFGSDLDISFSTRISISIQHTMFSQSPCHQKSMFISSPFKSCIQNRFCCSLAHMEVTGRVDSHSLTCFGFRISGSGFRL